jgi:hypothetical protein
MKLWTIEWGVLHLVAPSGFNTRHMSMFFSTYLYAAAIFYIRFCSTAPHQTSEDGVFWAGDRMKVYRGHILFHLKSHDK